MGRTRRPDRGRLQKLTEPLTERHLIVDVRSQDVPAVQLAPPKDRFGVLFVCTANICRSAYAAAYARGRSDGTIHFSSAGTHALVGQEMDPPMAAHLKQAGLDTTHRSRQLNRSVASHADVIITLTGDHRDYILDESP